MTTLTPEAFKALKDRFDYTLIFGMGMLAGKPVPMIMDEVVGEQFRVALADKVFVEGLDAKTFRIHTAAGHIDRPYCAEEKMWLQQLATKAVLLHLAQYEITDLKSRLLQAELEVATLRQSLHDAGQNELEGHAPTDRQDAAAEVQNKDPG